MDEMKLIKEKGKCCITGLPLKNCKHVNAVQLKYKAAWDYPSWGNVITKQTGMAIAYVHDKCIDEKGFVGNDIKFAVEFKGDEIIYHDVATLEEAEILLPPKRTCRVCGCTDEDACHHPLFGNCWWVAEDLCSHCEECPGEATRYSKLLQN